MHCYICTDILLCFSRGRNSHGKRCRLCRDGSSSNKNSCGTCLQSYARGAAYAAQGTAPAVAGNIAGAPVLKGGEKMDSLFSFASTAEDAACRLSNIIDAYWLLFEVLSKEVIASSSTNTRQLYARMPAYLSTLLVIYHAIESEKQALEQLQNDLYTAARAEKALAG